MSKLLTTTLIILFILLQYKLWIDKPSIIDIIHLQNTIKDLKANNLELRQYNQLLKADVKDLKSGHDALEERARKELGMVKKGEVFYQVVEEA